jgi:NADPH-dependent 2,4-dienoyl-CoA reductase/sulfur reductase-like enzyme
MNSDVVDLVIIGAGPAGMSAACEARHAGLSVVVLDEQPTIGGQIYRNIEMAPRDRLEILGKDYAVGKNLSDEFRECGAQHRGGATVWNVSVDGAVDYIAEGRSHQIVGRHVLLASGAMERPFPIPGWTLPGVMGAGAAQILLKGAGALPAGPIILVGCGPLLYLLAWQYLRAGVKIEAVVDTTQFSDYLRAAPHLVGALKGWRDLAKGFKLIAALRSHRVPIFSGASELSVEGESAVIGLAFRHRNKTKRILASLVLLHHGVVPNTQLSWSIGAEHRWNRNQLCWQPVTDEWGRLGETPIYVAGDSGSITGARPSAVQGRLAALAIGARLGHVKDLTRRAAALKRELKLRTRIRPFLDALYRPRVENRIPDKNEVLVCRCEEVTAGQIRAYVDLGCFGPNQTKAFGRCGMGPCQGRFCGLTVTEIIAQCRGVEPSVVGYYRIRPPIKPVMLGDFIE